MVSTGFGSVFILNARRALTENYPVSRDFAIKVQHLNKEGQDFEKEVENNEVLASFFVNTDGQYNPYFLKYYGAVHGRFLEGENRYINRTSFRFTDEKNRPPTQNFQSITINGDEMSKLECSC
jgi:hypothetical protein